MAGAVSAECRCQPVMYYVDKSQPAAAATSAAVVILGLDPGEGTCIDDEFDVDGILSSDHARKKLKK